MSTLYNNDQEYMDDMSSLAQYEAEMAQAEAESKYTPWTDAEPFVLKTASYPELFTPPITRRERRRLERDKKKKK